MAGYASSGLEKPLVDYISDILKEPLFYPPMALCAAMDAVFGKDKWWEFEYETILQELKDKGFPTPNNNILGEIQCISAIRRGKSFIDKEWHLFEKAVAAMTGIPVLFYEKQNLPIENVLHAMNVMSKMGVFEPSEEVEHYIGCEAINDEILWYPLEVIDNYLYRSLDRLKVPMGFDMAEMDRIRSEVSDRFDHYENTDIDNTSFKDESVSDQMCLRIFRSLLKGKELLEKENEALNTFNNIKDGVLFYSSKKNSPEISTVVDAVPEEADLLPSVDIVDVEESDDVFSDTIKEAMLTMAAEVNAFMQDFPVGFSPFEAFPAVKMAAIKEAGIPGSPIQTGVYIGHTFSEEPTNFDQEENHPREGTAEEVMAQVVKEELDNTPVNPEDIEDPFI